MNELNYTYTTTTDSAEVAIAAMSILAVVLIFSMIIGLAAYIISAIFLGKIFQKASVPSWNAWVPVLNAWKTFEIGGKPGWWAILMFIPFVNLVAIVFYYIAIHNINLKLRYDAGMTVLAIFLPLVWMIVAGVSKKTWDDSLGAPRVDQPVVLPTDPQQPMQPMGQPPAPGAYPQADQQPPAPAPVQPSVPPAPQPPTDTSPQPQTNTPPQPPVQ